MRPNIVSRLLPAVVFGLLTSATGRMATPDPLNSLRPGHPRLLASSDEWTQQVERVRTDPQLRRLAATITAEADALLSAPVATRVVTGRRLLSVSRDVLRRILQLVAAWHLTGNEAYAKRAEQEMLGVAAFSDWNPSHFLDVAEMTTAVAIGYDEWFDLLSPETRSKLRQAIVDHGLEPAFAPAGSTVRWHRTRNNWNQVCWGGLTLGALAIADDEPEIARKILNEARANIDEGLQPYAPDGLYPEGPGYWSYGTTYQVIMIEALRHALGDDWNLQDRPGFLPSAAVLGQLTGPTGMWFNFSDGGESTEFSPALLWFARELKQPGVILPHRGNLERWLQDERALADDRFTPLALLWWQHVPATADDALPLVWHTEGEQPVAVMRSSWTDPHATYLATKGGSASLNHAHMDAGSFVFEADGVRWARDLGAQSYNSLESKGVDLWNKDQDSERWTVFRLNNRSHNTLVIDDQLQRVEGHATIERASDGEEPFVVLDLSPVYAGQAANVRRGFRLDRHRRVLVQDEINGLRAGARARWAMVTGAEITIAPDGRSARLEQDGWSLQIASLSPAGARFDHQSAAPPADDFNAPNPNRRMLVLHATAPNAGALQFAVLMTPGSSASAASTPEVIPLSDWRP